MLRYTVIKMVKFKGVVYEPGDLLPETFGEKDVARHLWSRRFIQIEVPEAEPNQVAQAENKTKGKTAKS